MTKDSERENYQAFMAGLEALTREHRVEIRGCGCCGSPYLNPLEDGEVDGAYAVERDGPFEFARITWEKRK